MNDSALTPPRANVLVATVSVGAGHKSVASALAEELEKSADVQVARQDVMELASRLFRCYYAGGFALGMSSFPRLYGWGYRLADIPQGPGRPAVERLRLWTECRALRRFVDYVRRNRFDLIINTHFVSAGVIGHLIRQGRLEARQVVVATDIELHRFWYAQNVEHWFVPTEYSAGPLKRWGIDPQRITVSGMPVQAKWSAPVDRQKVLADWRLPADKPLVVLTGGTEFLCAPVPKIARAILEACPHVHLVVLAGHNKKLLASLGAMPEAPGRLTPVGFTDRLNELVDVCRLMITKPGGVTTAECLARAAPMVLLRPVPGHEAGNAAYLARQGAAMIARNVDQIAADVRGLLDDSGALERMADCARRLYRPGTQTVVSAVLEMLRGSSALPAGPA